MSDASNPPGGRPVPPNDLDDDAGETVTLSRYAPAAQPVLPFGGGAPASGIAAPQPYTPAPPAYPAAPPAPPPPAPPPPPPPAPAPAWSAPQSPAASPWSARAPMPRGLTPVPAPEAPPAPQGSALGVSNAAAAAAAPWNTPRPVPPPAVVAAAEEPAGSAPREALRLVWFDEAAVPRIRRVPAYRPILDAVEAGPLDRDLDDPDGDPDPMLIEDRRAVFEIAARGPATDARGVIAAQEGAIRADGKFVPAIVLVAGEIVTPFDELSDLEAVIAVATPLATPDDRDLTAAIEAGQRFLQNRGSATARSMARSLSARVREAFAREKKLAAGHLDEHVHRSLRDDRAFQRRRVLGAPHLRLLLHAAGADAPLVLYAPEAVAADLPMFSRFSARIIAEVHLQEDESEAAPLSLRALALVRRTSAPRPA